MTTQYDDLILKHTGNWKNTNAIVTKVGGDKSAIVQAIQRLVEMDYLEVKPNSNRILYKRKNTAQTEFNFIRMMEHMEVNQKTEINALSQFSTLLMKDGKRLRQKSTDVLEHINEEVNRAYMVKKRLNHQKNLEIISRSMADERIKKLDDYIVDHSQKEPELLKQLNKETWQKVLNPRMLSGSFQGRVLAMISKLIQPKNILEIGTFTGYSALCLAEGMHRSGTLFTIDKNEELESFSREYFDKSPYKKQIKQMVGNALEIIPTIHEKFDLVFIDADKSNYSNYFNLIIDKMNSGGVILSDNVLWSGKVIETLDPSDVSTKIVLEYNALLKEDPRLETVLLPIRDGLTVSIKK